MVNGELIMKKGYKRTDIGIVPDDWEVKKLGEIGSFSKGQGIRKDQSNSGSIPCVRYGELYTKHNDYIKQFYSFISEEVTQTSKKIKTGDILFAGSGETKEEIGKCVAFINDFEAYAGGDIVILSPLNTSSLFLGFLLNAPTIQKQKASRGQGDAVVHISSSQLQQIKIPLPPLPEQKAITEVLSDTDNLIQALEKHIAKKRLIKQGAMQKLLTPKDDWEVKKLGEIGECINGLTYSPDNVRDSGKLVLRSSNIQGSVLRFDNNVFVDIQVPEKLIVKKNDILICVRNGSRNLIGKCALIGGKAIGETFGAFMSVFRSPFNEFVFIVFQSSIIKKQIDEHLGATINQITNKSLNSFEILFPPKEQQTHIATILSDMDSEIEALEKKRAKYQLLKQGLMQNLLTGKIRLI